MQIQQTQEQLKKHQQTNPSLVRFLSHPAGKVPTLVEWAYSILNLYGDYRLNITYFTATTFDSTRYVNFATGFPIS